ncbi:hypothetical protein EDC94DRAFT_644915 [Helicostylum pulchrum]|nr:hypothetical protein EDC94DRAFT_644915 [Helicostylum pulchrum]
MPLSDITNKVSKRGKDLSDFIRRVICGLSQHANWNNTDISKELCIPRTTVVTVVKKSLPGRAKVLTERDERHLSLSVRREAFKPLDIHQQNLASITGNVSLNTLRKAPRIKGRRRLRRGWMDDEATEDWSKVQLWSGRVLRSYSDIKRLSRPGRRSYSPCSFGLLDLLIAILRLDTILIFTILGLRIEL